LFYDFHIYLGLSLCILDSCLISCIKLLSSYLSILFKLLLLLYSFYLKHITSANMSFCSCRWWSITSYRGPSNFRRSLSRKGTSGMWILHPRHH